MASSIHIHQVTTRRDLLAFAKFPWRVYKGDPNWVPPLISERLDYLNPEKNPFYQHAEVALFLARRGREVVVGTIASFVNDLATEHFNEKVGGFGFFEVIEDYAVAEQLLDTARQWVKARGMTILRGPTNFTHNDAPGVLIEGADCPPVMLAAHTPPYYKTLLERYGMEKFVDDYAWRAFRSQIGAELESMKRPEVFSKARMSSREERTTNGGEGR